MGEENLREEGAMLKMAYSIGLFGQVHDVLLIGGLS